MPATTRQMAQIAQLSEQSVRNYSREYAELLSPQARGQAGSRLFNDQDVQTLVAVAALRRQGVPQAEIIARLRAGDVYIDATPSPHQATPNAQEAPQATFALQVAQSGLQRQINELRATQRLLLRAAVLWGALLGAIAALVAAGFVVWVLWLTGH